jgi:5-methylcytosine-specific restriction endonuclease McrA
MSTLKLPDKEYAALCRAILERDHWKCCSCGSRNALHVHHIWFRSHGGPDMLWNLITLCSSCHDGVHKDVKDGQYGLTIRSDMNGFTFIRRPGWRPHD